MAGRCSFVPSKTSKSEIFCRRTALFTKNRISAIVASRMKASDLSQTSLRILNLEDDDNDAELNRAMISSRWPHWEVVQVGGRAEFIAALEEGGFDLILSDYTIPGFDGFQALAM